MEYRPSKEDDQENVQKAFDIMKDTMQQHPEIEPTLWACACWSVLVDGYINSGASYEFFCDEWDKVKKNYEHWWENE